MLKAIETLLVVDDVVESEVRRAMRLFRNSGVIDADDLSQEAFFVLLKASKGFSKKAGIAAWSPAVAGTPMFRRYFRVALRNWFLDIMRGALGSPYDLLELPAGFAESTPSEDASAEDVVVNAPTEIQWDTFTSREGAVLRLLARGFSRKQIAAKLKITAQRVNNLVRQLEGKVLRE